MGLALQKFKKYKEDKKVKKLVKQWNIKLEKHNEFINKTMQKAIEKSNENINLKFKKKRDRIQKQKQEYLDRDIRKVIGKKPKQVVLKTKPIKAKAYEAFQLYCRMLRADKYGMVTLLDNGERVHYKEAQGGHYFGKGNNPQLGFYVNNCRPISERMNILQGSLEGLHWKDAVIAQIGHEEFNKMVEMSKDTSRKCEMRTREHYERMLNIFSKLVEEESKRIKYHKKPKCTSIM